MRFVYRLSIICIADYSIDRYYSWSLELKALKKYPLLVVKTSSKVNIFFKRLFRNIRPSVLNNNKKIWSYCISRTHT